MTPDKKINPFEKTGGPVIETIRTPEGHEVSFSPQRGGIITSLRLAGREVLYMDDATFRDTSVSVKGGIPIMFPNAGPLESADFSGLKQHGFARISTAWRAEQVEGGRGFVETLRADDARKQVYPYDVELRVAGQFEDDVSFSLHQEVTNHEAEREAPVSMGLHPYFEVPHEEKPNIKFDFEGGDTIEAAVDQWANGKAVSVDNPKVTDPKAVLRVVLPSVGTLIIDASPEYRKIWIWSLPDKDFVCIEPVMRDVGGLVTDPEKVKPGETLSARVTIRLES